MADVHRLWADRIRAERKARGWDKAQMARQLARAAGPARNSLPSHESLLSYVKRWERGTGISERYRLLYAAAFDIPEEELFHDDEDDVERREFVGASLAAGLTFAISQGDGQPGRRTDAARRPVAPEVVDYFRDQLPGHYRAEMFLGPHHLIPTLTTQTQLIAELVEDAPQPIRRGLLDVGTAYAALLGWLHQDAGDLTWSARWRAVALDLAHRSGDPQLISYALSNKAQLATDTGDGAAVIDFTQAALDGERRLCPKVRILALQHQAHGYSLTGDRASVDWLIDAATSVAHDADDPYPWGNAYRRTPYYLEVQRATCYGRIGGDTAADAIRLWDQILDAMPESARRDNAVFQVRQAAALAVLGEPERVIEIAAGAVAVAAETGSRRLVRELLALRGRAAAWPESARRRELSEIIEGVQALEG